MREYPAALLGPGSRLQVGHFANAATVMNQTPGFVLMTHAPFRPPRPNATWAETPRLYIKLFVATNGHDDAAAWVNTIRDHIQRNVHLVVSIADDAEARISNYKIFRQQQGDALELQINLHVDHLVLREDTQRRHEPHQEQPLAETTQPVTGDLPIRF